MNPDYQTEYDHQVVIFEWADFNLGRYPELKLLNSSLNGVRLRKGQAAKAKKAGMPKGYPDINLPVPKSGYYGLYIELIPKTRGIKRVIRPKPDKDQKWWLQELANQGYYSCHCNGHEAAISVIQQYLEGKL